MVVAAEIVSVPERVVEDEESEVNEPVELVIDPFANVLEAIDPKVNVEFEIEPFSMGPWRLETARAS